MAPQTSAATTPIDSITAEQVARAGVPFPLALWYLTKAPCLRRFTEWDIDRIMSVRLQVALCGC